MTGGHDGDAQIDVAAFVFHTEAAVLRDATLGNVQITQHFDAREHRGMPFLGNGLHGVLQHPVDAVFDGDFRVARFDMNVTGAALERGEYDGFHEAHNRARGAIAGQAVAGNSLFALVFFLGSLKSESFGRLLEHALRLLGALQNVADLAGSSNANQELLAEKEGQLVAHLHLAGIGRGNGQNIVLHFQGHEVVTEHQVGRDGTKQFRVDALLAEINEGEAVSFREFTRELAFLLFVAGKPGRWRQLFRSGHRFLTSPPSWKTRRWADTEKSE